jgi:Tfp pilus assembly PilM family ATPase
MIGRSDINLIDKFFEKTNMENIGAMLYTEYSMYFIVSSIVLMVAMVAAIVLTLSHEEDVRRQDLFSQIESDHTSIIYKSN